MKRISLVLLFVIVLSLTAGCNESTATPQASPSLSPFVTITTPPPSPSAPDVSDPAASPDQHDAYSTSTTFDMDGDGKDENIIITLRSTVIFYDANGNEVKDESEYYYYDKIDLSVNGVSISANGENIVRDFEQAHFSDKSKGALLCIKEYGPSADDGTHIFSYDGTKVTHTLISGFITENDGKGIILTGYNYLFSADTKRLQWSSWQYTPEGIILVPVSKDVLIGKTITFEFGYPLTHEPDYNYPLAAIMGDYYEANRDEIIAELGDSFSAFYEGNTTAEITDAVFHSDDGAWPWLQIKLPSGETGWMSALYLGD